MGYAFHSLLGGLQSKRRCRNDEAVNITDRFDDAAGKLCHSADRDTPPIPFCVEGVVGSGLLTSGQPELPRRIEFETQVYHYESPWYEQIRGYFWLRAWDESGTTVELRTRQIDELVVEFTQEGGVATFRGPAEATVQRGGFARRYRGEVVVRALDGRPSPCLECPTDRLRVTFTSPELPSPITFEGYVIPRTGDIRVFRRCRP